MTYKLLFSETFNKQLDKLDKSVKQRLPEIFDKLRENPTMAKSFGHGYFRIRFVNYRILYHLDENAKTVYIIDVDKRDDIYDKYR